MTSADGGAQDALLLAVTHSITLIAERQNELGVATKIHCPFANCRNNHNDPAKMATIASFKTMFQRLGFSEDAATQLSSNNGEGLSSLDAIKALSDTRVHDVCKAVRRPGGADQGHQVLERAEHNMTICAFIVNLWNPGLCGSKDLQ